VDARHKAGHDEPNIASVGITHSSPFSRTKPLVEKDRQKYRQTIQLLTSGQLNCLFNYHFNSISYEITPGGLTMDRK
jgi:hypothetical protein